MQAIEAFESATFPRAFLWPASGTQFLPVSGRITDRLLVTYRASAAQLAALVPPPFRLDVHGGSGFLSVCAVEILGMGIAGTPRALRFDNREFLYRVAVRYQGEPTFLTLRSDVSSRALAFLGRHFSHYRPRLGSVQLLRERKRVRIECASSDGSGDAVIDVDSEAPITNHSSVFSDSEQATAFLLGMTFSADAVDGRVRVQPIEHSPWKPRFVQARVARFAFLEQLERTLGVSFSYDCTLATRDIRQIWKAARWI